jgi:hypothetical protein
MIPVLAQRMGILGLTSGPRIVSLASAIRRTLFVGIPRPRLIASPSAQMAARPSLTFTPQTYMPRHFRASRSPIVAPTRISQMTLGFSRYSWTVFRRRLCVRFVFGVLTYQPVANGANPW